jgi:hypothetical protein
LHSEEPLPTAASVAFDTMIMQQAGGSSAAAVSGEDPPQAQTSYLY